MPLKHACTHRSSDRLAESREWEPGYAVHVSTSSAARLELAVELCTTIRPCAALLHCIANRTFFLGLHNRRLWNTEWIDVWVGEGWRGRRRQVDCASET
eukprot:249054-Chlamydomonas_euryale.AAC.9